PGELFGGAGLAAEANQERFGLVCDRGRSGAFGAMRGREEPYKITIEPGTLPGRERRTTRNVWNVAAHCSSSICPRRTAAHLYEGWREYGSNDGKVSWFTVA